MPNPRSPIPRMINKKGLVQIWWCHKQKFQEKKRLSSHCTLWVWVFYKVHVVFLTQCKFIKQKKIQPHTIYLSFCACQYLCLMTLFIGMNLSKCRESKERGVLQEKEEQGGLFLIYFIINTKRKFIFRSGLKIKIF